MSWFWSTFWWQDNNIYLVFFILTMLSPSKFTMHKRNLYLIHNSHSPLHRKMCILPQVRCHCPPIWPPVITLNLTYIWLVPSTVIREPTLYKLLTFHVPNPISIFRRLCRLSKESFQVRGSLEAFVTSLFFYGEGVLASCPTPTMEDHPLSFVRSCLFNIFTTTIHSWRRFLHPQSEDAPCCGDRDPPNTDWWKTAVNKCKS
jgi:hypothetical protein